MDLGTIIGLGANVASGGILGVVGALIGKGLDIWHSKQELDNAVALLKVKNDHELAMQDKAAQLMKLEAESKYQVVMTEAQSAETISQMNAIAESTKAVERRLSPEGSQSVWFIVVDVLRGLTRPILTLNLDIVATVIAYQIFETMQGLKALDTATLNTMFTDLVSGLMFMASTATMWWFAARGIQPRKGA